MIKYDKKSNVLSIIAKDTGNFCVNLNNYLLDEGDVVYFTVNTELEKPEPSIQKVITEFVDNKAVIRLSKEDTNIPVGDYYYDIQVDTADGRVDTVVGPYRFRVLGGVTY